MTDLTRTFVDQDKPEVVSLDFPDVLSRGARPGYTQGKTPRSEWIGLAERKAEELGIQFRYEKTDQGLDVAFLSGSDASCLLAAIQPEWEEAALRGLRYMSRVVWRESKKSGIDPLPRLERMAADYDLSPQKLIDYNVEQDRELADLGLPIQTIDR